MAGYPVPRFRPPGEPRPNFLESGARKARDYDTTKFVSRADQKPGVASDVEAEGVEPPQDQVRSR